MGTHLSGLAQLVASLEGRTDVEIDLTEDDLLETQPLAASASQVPAPAAVEAFDDVARAAASARQRLEALAARVTELRRLAGSDPAERTRPVG